MSLIIGEYLRMSFFFQSVRISKHSSRYKKNIFGNSNSVMYIQYYMDRVKRIWFLSSMRAAKVQASLRIRAVSPEPSLLAHTSSESRGTFRQKPRSLAPLNGWACAVEICHDGMLEDTNSFEGAHIIIAFNEADGIRISATVFLPVPDKALLDDDLQIFGWTKSEFLFTDIEYYPSFEYYTSEFVIHNWLSALAMTVKYTTIFDCFASSESQLKSLWKSLR